MIVIFALSLPLVNPWVRGDGVGYYAYARSLLIEHNFNFTKDWQHGNDSFRMGRLNEKGEVLPTQFTPTGQIANLWTIGPSLLWLPFLLLTHLGILIIDAFGGHVPADGFSTPYLVTMALSTALYGFLGLWISFRLARNYFDENCAFLATLGIWWASSLPVYMYFNPSWSHSHSAFAVALLLWYWHRTREDRSWVQWTYLGLISGLAVDVYYPNGLILVVPLLEGLWRYRQILNSCPNKWNALRNLFGQHVFYLFVFVLALLPTLVSRRIIFGAATETGYFPAPSWNWLTPHFGDVLFSTDHGMFSWTPILILAVSGLIIFTRTDLRFAVYLITAFVLFYALIAFYPDWDGLSSFGNRFFISLTPVFVLGLASFYDWLSRTLANRHSYAISTVATLVLILWNLGLVFQWGTHLIPVRGPISFGEAAYNQVMVVPREGGRELKSYIVRRHQMMNQIEQQDINQLKKQPDLGKE